MSKKKTKEEIGYKIKGSFVGGASKLFFKTKKEATNFSKKIGGKVIKSKRR